MSSAFPNVGAPDPLGAATFPRPIPERGTHIPGYYMRNPHKDPGSVTVKQFGVPLLGKDKKPFTVAQVAPERRWPIGYDGELMGQEPFKIAKQAHVMEHYEMLRNTGHPDARYEGRLENEPIPPVEYFVSWRVDPLDESRLLEIGYDPDAGSGIVPDKFWDSSGEEIKSSRMEVLCQAYHGGTKTRAALTDRERAEVEEHLSLMPGATSADIASKLEVLTGLRNKGSISDADYMREVSALTGSGLEATEKNVATASAVSDKKQPTPARCGKECKGLVGVTTHERSCKKCKDIVDGEYES